MIEMIRKIVQILFYSLVKSRKGFYMKKRYFICVQGHNNHMKTLFNKSFETDFLVDRNKSEKSKGG